MAHGLICDFCSAPRPKWRYRVKSFVAFETRYFLDESKGDWAACTLCKDLIEEGHYERLAEHSMEALLFEHPELLMMPDRVVPEMKGRLKKIHEQFLENRLPFPPEELI